MRLFRSLLFQAALWAILPLLAITAVSVASIYGHQQAERALVADQVARLAHITADALSNGLEERASTGTPLDGSAVTDLGVNRLFTDMHLTGRASSYVIDPSGAILASQQPPVASDPVTHLPNAAEDGSPAYGAPFYDEAGETWVLGWARVGATGWRVVVREPWAEAVGPMARFAVLTPLLIILAALVSLAAVYLILAYVIRPLRRLGHAADRVALGDFEAVEQPPAGVQEIRDLHSTLQHTVQQIRRYQASMQSYVTAVTQGQEEERKRLARELHDDTAQSLVGLMQRIKLARRDLKRDPGRAEERLAELEQLSKAAWEDVRRFSEALRPAHLEQFGLEPALSTLCEQAGDLPGAPAVSLAVTGTVRRLPPETELALFRIVQEALNNVRQHAGAGRVDVRLAYGRDTVTVTVADDGRGFEAPGFAGSLAASGHFGLAGMRERALLVGGQLGIDSMPGRGTRIEVTVPD